MNKSVKKLVFIAVFTAISIVVLYVPFLRFPIFPSAAFLEYDAMDVPILLCSIIMGTGAGLAVTVISCFIQGITLSASSGLYGIIMHFIATGAFVIAASLVAGRRPPFKRLCLAMFCGCIAMASIMIPANLLVTPLFMGVPVKAVKDMILPIILPFNLIKSGINAAVVLLIYPMMKRPLEEID